MRENVPSWESLKQNPELIQLRESIIEIEALIGEVGLDKSKFPILKDRDWLNRVFNRVSSSYTITVIGQVSSGKSSFINSLFGRQLLLPSQEPTDGVISVLMPTQSSNEQEYAEKVLVDGTIERFEKIEDAQSFVRQQDTPKESQLNCKEVRFYLNEPKLKKLRIVNTPGLGDRLQEFEQVALNYLDKNEVDLIVWLFVPETAGNKLEVGLFKDALFRRRNSVIGVITRCLDGKMDSYDPNSDPNLIGKDGVVEWINQNLGEYMRKIILYDSHVTRKLISKLKDNPDISKIEEYEKNLKRSGFKQLDDALNLILGSDRQNIEIALVNSILNQCSSQASELAEIAEDIELICKEKAGVKQENLEAWQAIKENIIKPLRIKTKSDIREIAKIRSHELVTTLSDCIAYEIKENFGLGETVLRTVSSWSGLVDSATDAMNNRIEIAIEKEMKSIKFNELISSDLNNCLKEYFLDFKSQMITLQKEITDVLKNKDIKNKHYNISFNTIDISGEILASLLKTIIPTIIKSIESAFGKELAKRIAALIGTKISISSVFSSVFVAQGPFVIRKIIRDFKDNKTSIIDEVKAKYDAKQSVFESHIFTDLWTIALDVISEVEDESILSAQQKEKQSDDYSDIIKCKQKSKKLRITFSELSEKLLRKTES